LSDEEALTANEGAPESPLHYAAWRGDLEEVTRLVAGGADVNWRDSIGESALFGASSWGNVAVVRFLLNAGADCNLSENSLGYTPLHWAASHGNLETLKALIDAGADPTAADLRGRSPVDVAHEAGKGEHVAYLKSIGPASK
jgi:ankyrin repeat protein